ncbi:hypothetical protein HDU81_007952 [Chytriomyces hyalinus]|nr:hypothetical protein HDU81_007952 [Chytriomyces hyalinus]
MSERWDRYAEAYAAWSRRQTQPHAMDALKKLEIESGRHAITLLDVASGDGAFVRLVVDQIRQRAQSTIVATDYSAGMIRILDDYVKDNALGDIVQTRVMDGQKLEFSDCSFDHVSCIFGVFLMNDGLACLGEMRRVLKPKGTAVFTTWNTTYLSDLLLAGLVTVNPASAVEHISSKCTVASLREKTWTNPEWLVQTCTSAVGFSDVRVDVQVHKTRLFKTEVDDFVDMLLSGPGVQALMSMEGWHREEDVQSAKGGLVKVLHALFKEDKFVELVSRSNVVICTK